MKIKNLETYFFKYHTDKIIFWKKDTYVTIGLSFLVEKFIKIFFSLYFIQLYIQILNQLDTKKTKMLQGNYQICND